MYSLSHRYSRPYKKNEQSHIENFNKSLRSECFKLGSYDPSDLDTLQLQADQYTKHYINRRWHMGLPNMMTPAQFIEYYKLDPDTARMKVAEIYC
ncbi:transposase [Candidatus Nomurabacteria bacterium]|nr:transposase [Candidatus Nomurabacteria bacterium]